MFRSIRKYIIYKLLNFIMHSKTRSPSKHNESFSEDLTLLTEVRSKAVCYEVTTQGKQSAENSQTLLQRIFERIPTKDLLLLGDVNDPVEAYVAQKASIQGTDRIDYRICFLRTRSSTLLFSSNNPFNWKESWSTPPTTWPRLEPCLLKVSFSALTSSNTQLRRSFSELARRSFSWRSTKPVEPVSNSATLLLKTSFSETFIH